MIKMLKRAIKWYLDKSSETGAWCPSCTVPYSKLNINQKKVS